jgi:hypothetical protein
MTSTDNPDILTNNIQDIPEILNEAPIGYVTTDKLITLQPREFMALQHFLQIFEEPVAIINAIKDRNIEEKNLLLYTASDLNEDKTLKEEFFTKNNIQK